MDEQKDIHPFYSVKFPPSPSNVQKKVFEKQYQLMTHERLHIIEELAQQKREQYEINKKLMRFWYLDKQIEWKMSKIEYLERWNQDDVQISLPIKSIPRTTGTLCLSRNYAHTTVRPDRKRCQKMLIKKGSMDIDYVHEVREEHLSLQKSRMKTSCATQELDDMIESMVERIQHGNKKRTDEMKIYHEISNLKRTKEILISREPSTQSNQLYKREIRSKRDADWKRDDQHLIKIRLDDIEKIKREQIGRKARVRLLKGELEEVRKRISSLNKKLENVNSKRIEAYKSAYETEEKKKEMDSSYNEYQSFKTYVKELAQKGDVVELKYVCKTQVEVFMRKWNNNKAFREDYKKRMLVFKQHGDIL